MSSTFLTQLITALSQPISAPSPIALNAPTNKYRFQQPLLFQRAHTKSIPFTYTNHLGIFVDTGDRFYFNGQSTGTFNIGPTKSMLCPSSMWAWGNTNTGDWLDANEVSQGATPFSQSPQIAINSVPSIVQIDVTAAMQYIYTNNRWCAFLMRTAGLGTLFLVGPCNTTGAVFTTLSISYTDGSTEILQNWVIASLQTSTAYTNAMDDLIQVSAGISSVFEFFRPTSIGKTIQSATINLSINKSISATSQLKVYVCAPFIPSTDVNPGLAQNYTLDAGISTNSNVIVNQLITDSSVLSDVFDAVNSGTYSRPYNVGGPAPTSRGEFKFDPTLWGTPGVGHLAGVSMPTAAQLANLYPNKNFGKWVGVTWPEYFRIVKSDDTAALAAGFIPLAPSLGALELTMPGRNIANGQAWYDSGEHGTNVDLYFDRARMGQVNEIYMRYYVLLGSGWDAKETDFRIHFNGPYQNVGQYPEQFGANPITTPRRNTDFTGKFFGGAQQVTAGTVIPAYTFPKRQRADGTPDDTFTYQYVGGGFGASSGTLGYQGRCRFQQGFFKENLPGPAIGGASWGIEMYDFYPNSHCIPSQTFISGWDSQVHSSATANGGIGFMYPGKWYCLELRWKLNTLSGYVQPPRGTDYRESGFVADGVLQFFVDGILANTSPTFATRRSPIMDWATQIAAGVPFAHNQTALRPITNVNPSNYMGFASLAGNLYYGGRSPNPRTKKVYINGIVASTSYVGPMSGVSRANGGLGD